MTVYQSCQVGPGKQHGFSLFEMVLVILLIGVLMSLAIDRLLQLEIAAEKISVQHVIGTLNGAIHVQVAEMVITQGLGSIRQLENSNPMDKLAELPQNYVGVKTGEATNQVPVASWYFDPHDRTLVYKVKYRDYFESEIRGEPRIQLRLSLVYRDDIKSRSYSDIQGIKLGSLYEYNWKLTDQ